MVDNLTACNYSYMQLGLIDYNARFYSPSLGRFIQPDSIIPDLINSQAWNRYSYVLNSPIMYVDPSGHEYSGPCMDGEICGLPNTNTPQGGDNSNPSCSSTICMDGTSSPEDLFEDNLEGILNQNLSALGFDIYKTWQKLNENEGWWNPDGEGMTIEQYISYLLLVETNGNGYGVWLHLAEAMIQHLWTNSIGTPDRYYQGGHAPMCQFSGCLIGVFNWLAGYVQAAQDRTAWLGNLPLGQDISNDSLMFYFAYGQSIGSYILSPDHKGSAFNPNGAFHWGNYPGLYNAWQEFGGGIGYGSHDVVAWVSPDFFVLSGMQKSEFVRNFSSAIDFVAMPGN